MAEISKQIEEGIERVNSGLKQNMILLKKRNNRYTLYCLDSHGKVLMTLTFFDRITSIQAYMRLRLLGNIFL